MPRVRLTLCAVLLFCLPFYGWSQSKPYEAGKFYAGIKGGGNLVLILNQNNYGQIEMSYTTTLGLNAGAYLEYKLGGRSYITVEAAYQRQGQDYSDFFKRMQFDKSIVLDYVVFPVMYRFMLKSEGPGFEAAATFNNPKIYFSGGLQPGILTRAESSWRIDGQTTDFISFITEGGNPNSEQIGENGMPESTEDLFQKMDLVLVLGAGIRQNIQNNLMWFVEARGGIGLVDINAEEWRLPNAKGEYHKSRTGFLGIHVGLAFRLY